ncbi:transposase InsO family protein [Ochrobactrum daejeonense]|uniref:Transposase InsO family protein n=1 Tax=Brucella daejeonensis TaxID=659015 RepID=A0A7W9EPY6_9HYPH|nr:transposase InsO family protein [Brucella daejeonensis]
MVTPDAKQDAVAHVCQAHDVSQRRACSVLSVDRSSVRYRSIRLDDTHIRAAMRQVASERRRFGYRRIHVMLERQGLVMNLKKLRRLYREEKLTVPMNAGASISSVMHSPMGAGSVFSLSLMISHGSAWLWWRTRLCPACGSPEN